MNRDPGGSGPRRSLLRQRRTWATSQGWPAGFAGAACLAAVAIAGVAGASPAPGGAPGPTTTASSTTTLPPAAGVASPAGAGATMTVPDGAGSAIVPAVPSVPLADTAGQDPRALLSRAIALAGIATSQQPLQSRLAAIQQVFDAESVAADKAAGAAATAAVAEHRADQHARSAEAAAHDLDGALREAALRLYTGGTEADPSATDLEQLSDAAVYEDTILSPAGIAAQRDADAGSARSAARTRQAEARAAHHDALVAAEALHDTQAARATMLAQLASLGASNAALESAERTDLAAQAGKDLTSPAALDFTPSTPLPAPLATTPVALAWAFAQLGKPYVWGGTGPDVFDCSGLTQWSWAHAGVAIPRVAAAQDAWTVPVPLSQLLPGDLVFYGTADIHHVGMYIGDGLMINAPHTGTVVQVSSIWWTDLAGFGRVHAPGVPVPARVLPAPSAPAPAQVVPSAGAVPSESTPPPGYVATPGATSPVSLPPTAPLAAGSTTTTTSTTVPSVTTTSTTISPPSTTVPDSTTTSPPEQSTTSLPAAPPGT